MAIKEKKTLRAPQGSASLKIKLVRSLIGYPSGQRVVARGLGLRKLNSEVVRPNTPEIRGMINKISHVLKVEAMEEQ
jgi:large subunit ribosomal protein L30